MEGRKIFGLVITQNKKDANKLADDLMQLQSEIYRTVTMVNFLDLDSRPGHLNYELNKFGVAIAACVKDDLRKYPDKKTVEFYVNVLNRCWENNDYEIGARIKQGIEDAIKIDLIVDPANPYDLPEEDPGITAVRKALKDVLSANTKWHDDLESRNFPSSRECKANYKKLMDRKKCFIPSIQSLVNFIDIRMSNAKETLNDERMDPWHKCMRISEMKSEILNELLYIEYILSKFLPRQKELHFQDLHKVFANELLPNLAPAGNDPGALLDEMLKMKFLMEAAEKVVTEQMNPRMVAASAQSKHAYISPSGKPQTIRRASQREITRRNSGFFKPAAPVVEEHDEKKVDMKKDDDFDRDNKGKHRDPPK